MTLEEAIYHCKEKEDCTNCGLEHKQLREWLEEYKQLKLYYDCIFFDETKKLEDGYFDNLKTLFQVYYFVEDEELSECAISLKRGLHRFLEWIKERENQPLKFEELHEDMWVWDNKTKKYRKILYVDTEIKKIVFYNQVLQVNYKENRFYRYEVKE